MSVVCTEFVYGDEKEAITLNIIYIYIKKNKFYFPLEGSII